MKILFDTNIVLDVLMNRPSFYKASLKAIRFSVLSKSCHVNVKQLADIYYILRQNKFNKANALVEISKFADNAVLVNVSCEDFYAALHSNMMDFEDALLAHCAKRHYIDCIVTRNTKDFAQSPVKALSPDDFLELYETQ